MHEPVASRSCATRRSEVSSPALLPAARHPAAAPPGRCTPRRPQRCWRWSPGSATARGTTPRPSAGSAPRRTAWPTRRSISRWPTRPRSARWRPPTSCPGRPPEEKEARSAAIAEAIGGAARPPADLMAAAVRLIGLAEELLPVANKNVISDIAAASAAITAAAITARVNIEANLPGIRDEELAAELKAIAALADGVADRADRVVTAVREEISQVTTGAVRPRAGEDDPRRGRRRGGRARQGGPAAPARGGHRQRRRRQRRLRPLDRQRRGAGRASPATCRAPPPRPASPPCSPSSPTTPRCTASSCRPRSPTARTWPAWRPRSRAAKDVDGASPESLGRLVAGLPAFAPATAEAVLALLDHYQVELRGRHAVVVGRSVVVGKPVAHLLLDRHATVTICHSRTADLAAITRQADVLVAAVGPRRPDRPRARLPRHHGHRRRHQRHPRRRPRGRRGPGRRRDRRGGADPRPRRRGPGHHRAAAPARGHRRRSGCAGQETRASACYSGEKFLVSPV